MRCRFLAESRLPMLRWRLYAMTSLVSSIVCPWLLSMRNRGQSDVGLSIDDLNAV